ncbi:MAG TPA: T9SS type A sorting domain-containing protein, partial [Candidatus Kapabacteria bacterium]
SASLVYQDSLEAAERHILWADSVKTLHWSNTLHFPDTANFPEDTTIPTIQQLGLEVLLGPPADVTPTVWQQGTIGDLTASENPFNKETTVSFNMGEYAYISFQLTDVLGHIVQGDFKGTVLPPGDHSFSIDGSTLSSGTYFARITSPSGITRTIKLVRE